MEVSKPVLLTAGQEKIRAEIFRIDFLDGLIT